jgi:hypothetical protein
MDFTDINPDDDPELYAEQYVDMMLEGIESEGVRRDTLIEQRVRAEDFAHTLRTMYIDFDRLIDSGHLPAGYAKPVRNMMQQVTSMADFYEALEDECSARLRGESQSE